MGVLGSTRGSSLQLVLESIRDHKVEATIALCISDRKSSGILDRVNSFGYPTLYLPAAKQSREQYDRAVSDAFVAAGVQVVMLVGYMRILSAEFVHQWRDRCFNVHPSLLPEFAGGMDLGVHSQVIAAKKDVSGCTVHLVTEVVDGGPILVQLKCPVLPEDSPESLKARVQSLEGPALLRAIDMFRNGQVVTAA